MGKNHDSSQWWVGGEHKVVKEDFPRITKFEKQGGILLGKEGKTDFLGEREQQIHRLQGGKQLNSFKKLGGVVTQSGERWAEVTNKAPLVSQ